MEPFKIFVLGSVLAVALAVNFEPILPTPPPTDPSVKANENAEMKSEGNATQKEARAMNISLMEAHSSANSIHANVSAQPEKKVASPARDLSDVSMDEDMDLEFSGHGDKSNSTVESIFGQTRVLNKPHISAMDKIDTPFGPPLVSSVSSAMDVIASSCVDSGKIYKVGESIEKGCESICKCSSGGQFICEDRCQLPLFRKGKKIDDPLCSAAPVEDQCCAIMVCAADGSAHSVCKYANKSYSLGEIFHEGCERTCECEAEGKVTCKPRCPVLEQRDDCVNVPDSKDSCCMVQLCDVTQDVDENTTSKERNRKQKTDTNKIDPFASKEDEENESKEHKSSKNKNEPIMSVNRIASGAIQVLLSRENSTDKPVYLELSSDNGLSWSSIVLKNGQVKNLQDGHDYIVRSKETGKQYKVSLPLESSENNNSISEKGGCMYKGKHRSIDEEFHIGCDQLCFCGDDGKVECANLQCPSTVGLDIIDPNCVKWSPDPPDFKPSYPMCCPPAMKCVSNGSCTYKDQVFPNWSQIPISLSGCEQRCFCESGAVECQNVCAPLPAIPPATLNCQPPSRPAPMHPPDDNCCKEWACAPAGHGNSTDKHLTDFDKDILKHFYGQNETNKNKNSVIQPPIFVTLPPDLHNAIKETYGNTDKKYKIGMPYDGNIMNTQNKKDSQSPQLNKSEKNSIKHYEYPGPYADPNHQPQPPQVNGLGPFPFIKKPKDKQIYTHDSNSPNSSDSVNYGNDVNINYQNSRKNYPNQNDTKVNSSNKHFKMPNNHEEYPINDPYLSGNPIHVPFNQNGPGPGFFNPETSKAQQEYLNTLNVNGNSNGVHPALIQPGNGIYGNGIPNRNPASQGPETIHVFTDGSPIHIEHLLQQIQQADPNAGSYIPFLSQPHQTNIPNNQHLDNENNTSFNIHPGGGIFPQTPNIPGYGNNVNDAELQVVELDPISPTTVRLVLNLPALMVGLQGHVKLRYTDSDNPDPNTWRSQEFATSNSLLASQQLEFQLGSLQPETLYHVQASVISEQLSFERKSRVHNVRTLPLEEKSTLPPIIPIEPNLSVGQINSTSAQIVWRPFTQDELQFIDGIQLRYREIDGKVFSGTPLIHRAVTSFQLEGLKPNTSYEVGIYFIPFLGQHTELQSANMMRFNTTTYTDIYDWNVVIEIDDITPWSLMIKWNGVPRPAERYVHIYRAVWRAEAARKDTSSFTLPNRGAPQETNVTNLTPGTKYRIWLELYLTNGKIKNSNVKDIMTKPGKPIPQTAAGQEGKLLEARGDYYSSLVVVAILAALGAMCSLILLLVLLRRHRTASAPICGPVPATRTTPALPPYDSPTYKLDLHQETMDL